MIRFTICERLLIKNRAYHYVLQYTGAKCCSWFLVQSLLMQRDNSMWAETSLQSQRLFPMGVSLSMWNGRQVFSMTTVSFNIGEGEEESICCITFSLMKRVWSCRQHARRVDTQITSWDLLWAYVTGDGEGLHPNHFHPSLPLITLSYRLRCCLETPPHPQHNVCPHYWWIVCYTLSQD